MQIKCLKEFVNIHGSRKKHRNAKYENAVVFEHVTLKQLIRLDN